jgi:hypothetical protein
MLAPDTNIKEASTPNVSSKIQVARKAPNRQPGSSEAFHEPPPVYSSWDDFRTNSPAVLRALTDLAARPIPPVEHAELWNPPIGAEEQSADLGDLLATFYIQGESRFVGVGIPIGVPLLLIALSIGSFLLAAINPNRADKDFLPFGFLFGVLALIACAIGIWYLFFRNPNHSRTYWVFDDGILCQLGKRFEVRRWEKVRDFRIDTHGQNTIYWLTILEGMQETISILNGENAIRLMEMIDVKILAARLLPTLRRIFEGEKVKFGAVALHVSGFSGPSFFAPWGSIKRVATDLDGVNVQRAGHRIWQTVPFKRISFPSVVLAISQIMIEEVDRIAPNAT